MAVALPPDKVTDFETVAEKNTKRTVKLNIDIGKKNINMKKKKKRKEK
jgi:hypothetical protein